MVMITLLAVCASIAAGCGKKTEPDAARADASDKKKKSEQIKIIEESDTEPEITDKTEAPQPETPEKKGILIALDPGHQGPNVDMSDKEPNAPGSDVMKVKATGGTSGNFSGIPEYQLNLDIALMVRDRLVEQGYDVVMTRENNDTAISNSERAKMANDAGADISVRIHANGSEDPGVSGALTLIGSAENPYVGALYDRSYRLAENILNAYCAATGMQNLGIQPNDTMTGINWSQIPVVILEMGFMTNQQDDMNMADAAYRESMVNGIVDGINRYYGF